MNATLPTKTSFELAIQLNREPISSAEELFEAAMEIQAVTEEMMKVPAYLNLIDAIHNTLEHSKFSESCEGKIYMLANFCAQMFCHGWAAGRQEVMDSVVERVR